MKLIKRKKNSLNKIIHARIIRIARQFSSEQLYFTHMNPLRKGKGIISSMFGCHPWKVTGRIKQVLFHWVIKEISAYITNKKIAMHAKFLEYLSDNGFKGIVPRYIKSTNNMYVVKQGKRKFICQYFIKGDPLTMRTFPISLRLHAVQFLAKFHAVSQNYCKINMIKSTDNLIKTRIYSLSTHNKDTINNVMRNIMEQSPFEYYVNAIHWKKEYENIQYFHNSCYVPLFKKMKKLEKYIAAQYALSKSEIFFALIYTWLNKQINTYYERIGKLDIERFIRTYVHGDFSVANILYDKQRSQVCGLVDFDHARADIRMIDFVNLFDSVDTRFPDYSETMATKILAAYSRACKKNGWEPLTKTELTSFYDILRMKQCYLLSWLNTKEFIERMNNEKMTSCWIKLIVLRDLLWFDKKIQYYNNEKFVRTIMEKVE